MDYKAVLTNAKRGYATLSIAWAGESLHLITASTKRSEIILDGNKRPEVQNYYGLGAGCLSCSKPLRKRCISFNSC